MKKKNNATKTNLVTKKNRVKAQNPQENLETCFFLISKHHFGDCESKPIMIYADNLLPQFFAHSGERRALYWLYDENGVEIRNGDFDFLCQEVVNVRSPAMLRSLMRLAFESRSTYVVEWTFHPADYSDYEEDSFVLRVEKLQEAPTIDVARTIEKSWNDKTNQFTSEELHTNFLLGKSLATWVNELDLEIEEI